MTQAETMWTGKTVLVTGGSSFIGSTLADQLILRGANVRVVDDLTSGHLGNIAGHIATGKIEFIRADLRDPGIARGAMQGVHTETVSVVGSLCTPLDLLADGVSLPRADVGDLVVVFQAGAYGLTASPVNFLSHPAPLEVLV